MILDPVVVFSLLISIAGVHSKFSIALTETEENYILGDPRVSCSGDFIEIRFGTKKQFNGLVFVEGHLNNPQCRSFPFDQETTLSSKNNSVAIRLNFWDCGAKRVRSTTPRGMFISISGVVLAFHPSYLTKSDRVFNVKCYYMEMELMLNRELTIRPPPVGLQAKQIPMPTCRYELLSGGPHGPFVTYGQIGQMVYHKWTCDTEYPGIHCMIVHSCFVDDGSGNKVELINERGCARDRYLLQNIEYVSDLMAGKEAHIYRYAEKQAMYFDCQITITVKEPNQEYCDIPICPDPNSATPLQYVPQLPPQPYPYRIRRHISSIESDNTTSMPVLDTSDKKALSPSRAKQTKILKGVSSLSMSASTVSSESEEESGDRGNEQQKTLIGEHFAPIEDEKCMSAFGLTLFSLLEIAIITASGMLYRNAYLHWRGFEF